MCLRIRPPWLLAGATFSALALGLYTVWHDPVLGGACPGGEAATPPDAVHLTPTLFQHQNWVGLARPANADGEDWIYVCTQGEVVGRRQVKQMEFDPVTGIGEVKIATRWVDLAWLSGDLDQYRDPARWTLVYTREG